MKPNFALNLSHEGISLLHRAQAGWLRVGDVSLNDPALKQELGMLRKTAADLEAGGLTTKLVIPNSQILYTDIDTPGPSTADRIVQIRDGLVGLTPYDVSELVFDWRLKGNVAQVAVVARETLQEAESFAAQYRFNPVSFVAVPGRGEFDGEPFFGPTRHAASLLTGGETIEPDGDPIRVLGTAEAAPKPAAKPKAPPATPKPAPSEAAAKGAPAKAPASSQPQPAQTQPAQPKKATAAPLAPDPKAGAGHADAPKAATEKGGSAATKTETPGAAPADDALPAVSFASQRASTGAPVAGVPALDRVAPRIGFASRAAVATPDPPTAKSAAKPAKTAATSGAERTPMPMTAPQTAEREEPADRRSDLRRKTKKSLDTARAATSAITGTLGKLGRGATQAARRLPAKAASARTAKAPAPTSTAAAGPGLAMPPAAPQNKPTRRATSEAEAMTVFGARGRTQQRGKPRYLGLVLTLLLLLALAILAIWSTYFMSDVTSGWFGTFDEDTEIARVVDPAPPVILPPRPAVQPSARVAPSEPEPNPEPEPVIAGAPTPDDNPVDAATETPGPAPAISPEIASEAPAQLPAPQSAIEDAIATALTQAPDIPLAQPETAPEAPVDVTRLEQPQTEAPLPDATAPPPAALLPLTRPEAEARYAASGIWQLDPEPPANPATDRADDVYVAAVDPAISALDAVALPSARSLTNDQRPTALTAPAPLGTEFDLDDRGLVRATPEGALTPDGILIFLGQPPVAPGPRPADLRVPEQDTRLEPGPQREDDPRAQPDNAGPGTETARLGGFSQVELAAVRPTVRPPTIPEQAQAEEAATEASANPAAAATLAYAEDDATELAVVASRMPPTRPADLAARVEKAQKEATPTAPERDGEAGIQAAAARMPPVPTRASVAKQATVENAINLNKVNLIGVYGSPSQRRALVRLASGRYVKVQVGDRVDGGKVAAIGDTELRYVKGGRNITLKLPKG